MSDLLKNLNDEQKNAVTHIKEPLLIIAGAGTGKTTVITNKIAYIIEQKLAKPSEILALTFTDKASEEMAERVDKLLPYGVFDMWISTFHSFCDRILGENGLDIGLPTNYRLINTTESWLLMKKNLYALNLDYYRPKGNETQCIHALIKLFSRLKDENITPEEYHAYAEGLLANQDTTMGDESSQLEMRRIKETADAYFQYEQLLLDNNFLDFGDLIFYVNKLFVQRPNIREKYQKQFKYILIDEFQDTNLAQYNLIKLLRADNMITVVGDDDQAIYKFRGASVSNILNFKNDFPDSREIVLTKNYRSTQEILDTAYNFIQNNNPDRLEYQLNNPDEYYKQHGALVEKINKKLVATRENSGTVALITAQTEEEEVQKVIATIIELMQKQGITYNDIALLVRANKTAESYIKALEIAHIPYIRVANTGLYKQELVADIIAYGRILFDRADASSLVRVFLSPLCALETEELLNLTYIAKKKSSTFYEMLNTIRALPKISEKTAQSIEHLFSLIREHATQAQTLSVQEMLIKIITDLKIREYLIELEQKKPQKGRETIEYVRQFIEKAGNFALLYEDKSLHGFITHIDMEREAGDSGALGENLQEQGPESVKVMTIHASKGLEFSYVFIPQLVIGRFPSIGRSDLIELPDVLLQTREILPEGDPHIQEERRLLYVGLTRAKDGVFLSAAESYGGKRLKKPSQFLFETGLLKDKNATTPTKSAHATPAFLIQSALDETKLNGEKFSYPVPQKFSYSQIAAFNICPLQYKYQFVLRIPQDKGRGTFSFGRTMHNTLLELFKLTKARSGTVQESLFSVNSERNNQSIVTLDEIYGIYRTHWIDEWYESQDQKQQYYKAGQKILKEFYDRHKDSWPNPWYLEKDFTVTFEGIRLKGRIDRIDKVGDNNGVPLVEIVDYKTGKYKEKLYKNDKIQLLIYQIALEDQGLKPVNLRYYYLHEDKQESTSFLGKPEEIAKTKKEIVETVEKIKRSDFPANPSEFNCKHCDFKNICPFSVV